LIGFSMNTGTIKEIKVNPKTEKGAILFEDGKAYYINTLKEVKNLMYLFNDGNPIGKRIGYELSEDKIDNEGIIGKFCVVD